MAKKRLLEVEAISKFYPGVKALDDVSFDLFEGEVHCLVGKNGAGKSTLIELLAGSIRPDRGSIKVFDQSYAFLNPAKSISLGIQTIHQQNQLVPFMTVSENMFLGNLKTGKAFFFSLAECSKAAEEIFSSIGVDIDPTKRVHDLTPVEKKVLSIAKAFSEQVKILILDEPTASLDREVEEKLFDTIRNVTSRGVGVIYISHNLQEIFILGTRVTVLRNGKKISTHRVQEVDEERIINEMIGGKRMEIHRAEKSFVGEEVLQIRHYSRKDVVKDISFDVRKGEIFGLGGLVGSGRTELARLIFGVDRRDSGQLLYNGEDITPTNTVDAIVKGLGFLTEDRMADGLMSFRPLSENISLVDLIKRGDIVLKLKQEQRNVEKIADQLNIVTPSMQQLVHNLSGGNRQKVVFAKWLLTNSKFLILDEPTVGIDVEAKNEIYRLMDSLLDEGKFIIMISSDIPELVQMSDRVGIIRRGALVKILGGDEVTEENVLKFVLGSQDERDAHNE
jgi:ribose transport system ATP-binding protein